MLSYILLDLNLGEWRAGKEDPLTSLRVYIAALKLSSFRSTVRIVNSLTVLYDSDTCDDISAVLAFEERSRGADLRIGASDLGFAIVHKPDTVLIYSMSPEDPGQYLRYIKCMFVAQKYGIRIDAYCQADDMSVKMCCQGTGGVYLEKNSTCSLLGLLGNVRGSSGAFPIRCFCCDRSVHLGLVCPICLAVYCKFLPVCKRCKTKFTFDSSSKSKLPGGTSCAKAP